MIQACHYDYVSSLAWQLVSLWEQLLLNHFSYFLMDSRFLHSQTPGVATLPFKNNRFWSTSFTKQKKHAWWEGNGRNPLVWTVSEIEKVHILKCYFKKLDAYIYIYNFEHWSPSKPPRRWLSLLKNLFFLGFLIPKKTFIVFRRYLSNEWLLLEMV